MALLDLAASVALLILAGHVFLNDYRLGLPR